MLNDDEFFPDGDRTVVQVRVMITPTRETAIANSVADTVAYRKGDLGPRGYRNAQLPEGQSARYIGLARTAIKTFLSHQEESRLVTS